MNKNIFDLISKIKVHCDYTFLHSIRVANDLYGFANYLGIKNPEKIFLLGALHDIGKIKVDESILNKKEKLTQDEFEKLKLHTVYGEEIVAKIPWIAENFENVILFHHENFDGSGYFGKENMEIPLISRMIRIVDSYDAMCYERVYQKPKDNNQALEELYSLSAIQYDSRLIRSYIEYKNSNEILVTYNHLNQMIHLPC